MTTTAEKFAATFATTEHLSDTDLRRYRLRALERITRHARAEAPFYRRRLDCLFDAADQFLPDAWERVPILTRAQAQENGESGKAKTWPAKAGDPVPGQTSGSTGMSFHHLHSTLSIIAAKAMTDRLYRWHRFDPDKTFACIVVDDSGKMAAPHGCRGEGWAPSSAGASWYLDITGTAVNEQIEWLERVKPAYLLTFPSAALAIARTCEDRNLRLPLEAIVLIGETVSQERRAAIEAASGARVVAAYGAHELGLIAGQCPQGSHYHVCAESQFVELLDDNGSPVAPGQPGRVVVTNFYNFAMPFIRYALGDYAIGRAGRCSCGRSLPIIEDVIGRQSCIFTFPGNRKIWPQAASARLQELVANRQYQIAQTGPLAVEYRYVPRHARQTEDRDALVRFLREQFDPRIDVAIRAFDEIPRKAGGKYDEYICEVPAES